VKCEIELAKGWRLSDKHHTHSFEEYKEHLSQQDFSHIDKVLSSSAGRASIAKAMVSGRY